MAASDAAIAAIKSEMDKLREPGDGTLMTDDIMDELQRIGGVTDNSDRAEAARLILSGIYYTADNMPEHDAVVKVIEWVAP